MKKTVAFLAIIAALSLSLVPCLGSASADGVTTKRYGNGILVTGEVNGSWSKDVWDLAQGSVTVSYELDLSRAPVATAPNYSDAGFVGLFYPGAGGEGSAGAQMTGYALGGTDRLHLQRRPNPGDWSESMYDVTCGESSITIPSGPVDSSQSTGVNFTRTTGKYRVEIVFRKVSDSKGVACPKVNGMPTSIVKDGTTYSPAGLSFDTNVTQMEAMKLVVFGSSSTGKIAIRDLTVAGYMTKGRGSSR